MVGLDRPLAAGTARGMSRTNHEVHGSVRLDRKGKHTARGETHEWRSDRKSVQATLAETPVDSPP